MLLTKYQSDVLVIRSLYFTSINSTKEGKPEIRTFSNPGPNCSKDVSANPGLVTVTTHEVR